MPENSKTAALIRLTGSRFRNLTARWLGVKPERKEDLYFDLLGAATLADAVYWLQILFAAGIATLGLVLNSPAVIIGAMLISPLMSPILASGLAFATGDLVLGLRAIFKLFLSCTVAISFAVLLVVLLPFREMTTEIAARTQPNTLDLLIALFSGAVGSIATCREVKGVVTSIPGVAIAVALMPPLCVVGYGIGLLLVFDQATGMRVATGGGLLFLTNLVAITFTAMLVFVALKINTAEVREKAEEWEQIDPESSFVINSMRRFVRLERARKIHSMPLRFVMILIPLGLILIPLSNSFSHLQTEIARKQQENLTRQKVTDLWQKQFQINADGQTRSTIDQLTISERDGKTNVYLRVFDDRPYTAAEKANCARLIAENLQKPVEKVSLQLIEVPTTSLLDSIREREQKPLPPTLAQLQANFRSQAEAALDDLKLPETARLLDGQITTSALEPLHIKLIYFGENNIEPHAQTQIVKQIKTKLGDETAIVTMERIPPVIGDIAYPRNRADLPVLAMLQLDFAGRVLRENPQLNLLIAASSSKGENEIITAARFDAVVNYLQSRWQIASDQIKSATSATSGKPSLNLSFEFAPMENHEAKTTKIENAATNEP